MLANGNVAPAIKQPSSIDPVTIKVWWALFSRIFIAAKFFLQFANTSLPMRWEKEIAGVIVWANVSKLKNIMVVMRSTSPSRPASTQYM